MSQRAVEKILGRLVTDEGFREAFFEDAAAALRPEGLDVTPDELDALLRVPPHAIAALCARLDDRICRLNVPATPRG